MHHHLGGTEGKVPHISGHVRVIGAPVLSFVSLPYIYMLAKVRCMYSYLGEPLYQISDQCM